MLKNPQKNDLDPDPIIWQKMDLDVSPSLIRVRRLWGGETRDSREGLLSSPATGSCGPRHLDLQDRISIKKWVVVIKVFGWEEILTTDLQVQKLKFYHCATP